MKYKVGDKVRVKSLDWYNQNKDSDGDIYLNDFEKSFIKEMSAFCGKEATVVFNLGGEYQIDIDNKEWGWYDWMLEDEPTTSDQLKEKRFHAACYAMNGIVSGLMQSEEWHGWTDKYIAERAYSLADELLKQGGFTE